MAPPSNSANPPALLKRIVSSLVLLAMAGVSFWYGYWLFALFLSALTAVMVWEWCRLVGMANKWMVAVFCIVTAAMPWLVEEHRVVISLHGVAVILGASLIYTVERFGKQGWLVGLGPALISTAMLSGQYLRDLPALGLETVLWVVGIVVATDVGGYVAGKTIGGPRLAPTISPGKTWAGLAGAVVFAVALSILMGLYFGAAGYLIVAAIGAFLALAAQSGDLLESAWKRQFNVKDSSGFLPGHGGFLDRFDGYLTVLPIVALMAAYDRGSPITWQW